MTGKNLLAPLFHGELVDDGGFDRIYTETTRSHSACHWTPVAVAVAAAKLLVRDRDACILDVGSGVGKFCHIGATVTPGSFYGIEQRAYLVDEARRVCVDRSIDRAHFAAGNALAIDWAAFDGIYLFNPFYEFVEPACRLDGSVDLNASLFSEYVAAVGTKLQAMPSGARVVTYHGYGGLMPLGFEPYFFCRYGGDYLRAWVKV